jgi:hypothetical protein
MHHAVTASKISITGRPATPGSTENTPVTGIMPYSTRETTKRPRLLCTEGNRPPLSQSFRPTRLLEERERGAEGGKTALKVLFTRERGREGAVFAQPAMFLSRKPTSRDNVFFYMSRNMCLFRTKEDGRKCPS